MNFVPVGLFLLIHMIFISESVRWQGSPTRFEGMFSLNYKSEIFVAINIVNNALTMRFWSRLSGERWQAAKLLIEAPYLCQWKAIGHTDVQQLAACHAGGRDYRRISFSIRAEGLYKGAFSSDILAGIDADDMPVTSDHVATEASWPAVE